MASIDNIQNTIQSLYREMVNSNGPTPASGFAEALWNNRTEQEIERDTFDGVTLEDYKNWCSEASE